jgi:hypothetical protein
VHHRGICIDLGRGVEGALATLGRGAQGIEGRLEVNLVRRLVEERKNVRLPLDRVGLSDTARILLLANGREDEAQGETDNKLFKPNHDELFNLRFAL